MIKYIGKKIENVPVINCRIFIHKIALCILPLTAVSVRR